MARLANSATKAERVELHKAKMAGKKFDRERRWEARQQEIAEHKARLRQMIAQMQPEQVVGG